MHSQKGNNAISGSITEAIIQYRGVEQLVARQAHNLEVARSSRTPATKWWWNPLVKDSLFAKGFFFVLETGKTRPSYSNMVILYIHGFASSGTNGSAVLLRNHFYPSGVQVLSPDVPVEPLRAIAFLKEYVAEHRPDLIIAVSMGAMYAEQLHGIRRILVSPSFIMARLLTFRGMGRQEFRNPRADGAKGFKVDKQMIADFKEVEKQSFKDITPEEKQLVWGLFGTKDKHVNCQADFRKHYGTAQMSLFEGEHYLNGAVLSHVVIPLAEKILG